MKPVLLDTSVIVALLDSSDSSHQRCAEALSGLGAALVTCEAVIAESCFLLRRVVGGAEAILHSVATREFLIPLALPDAAAPIQRILQKYADREVGLADAFLIHLASEFKTGEILTLDRDFHVYRWGRNNAFHLLVPLNS